MLFLRPSITSLLVVVAVTEAANLRQEQRKLQTYTQSDDYFSLMLDRVNQARAAEGLPALCTNKKLQEAAQRHSDDQAANNYMDHTGTDGSNVEQRISQAGFGWSAVAENVAAGQPDVDSVMDAWMASPGHRDNIMGDYTMFGTAYAYNADTTYQHYWTQDFGTGEAEECDSGGVADNTTPTQGKPVKNKSEHYTKQSKIDDSCSGSQVKETEAPCTDTPLVVTDPPEIGTTTYEGSKAEDSCSGSHDRVTEAPCTDAPVMVADSPTETVYEGNKADDSCSGSQEKETEAPCTDAPVVVAKADDSCSGSLEKETEAPCTEAPVVVAKADDSCSGSQEKETEAPCTEAPVVVAKADDSCSGSLEKETETPCTDVPVVKGTESPVSQYTNAPTTELPEETAVVVPEIGTPAPEKAYNPGVQLPVTNEPHHNKDDCAPGW